MKRIGNLYEKICSIENLRLADEKARKGKLNSHGVIKHDKNRDLNLKKLHEILINCEFKTSEYDIFKIYEPKERVIHRLPYFPDRIVHHAVMNILEPIWRSIFTSDTYSCIKGRGIHATAKNVKRVLIEDPDGTVFCLKIDIRKFYPSVDHEILKLIIRKKIKDNRLLMLLDEIIDSADGIPIGNYLSQYFANLYLAYFDHWIKEEKHIKHYFRYADDMVIFGNNKEKLHLLLNDISLYMDSLKLTVKGNWQVFPVESRGVDFVGYVFYHNKTLLRKSIKQNFCKKMARINKSKNKISEIEFKKSVSPWLGWLKYCNSINLINNISKNTKYEIKFEH